MPITTLANGKKFSAETRELIIPPVMIFWARGCCASAQSSGWHCHSFPEEFQKIEPVMAALGGM
ncbi:MAG: hypothetical protein WAV82_11520 [Methylobacter sp.]